MHRLFLSDLHLEDPEGPAALRFSECLAHESVQVDEIYILGDLVEMWIGDDDDSPLAKLLSTVIKQASANCSVFLMHGNRDFLFGEAFCSYSGARLLEDPTCIDAQTVVSHGDALCTDDEAYQTARLMFRSDAFRSDMLGKSLTERRTIGQSLRDHSKQSNANKAANIMDVNDTAVTELLQRESASNLVHGHTHRPGRHFFAGGQRIVLGAWDRCGWVVRQLDDQFNLECFSLAHRYGT